MLAFAMDFLLTVVLIAAVFCGGIFVMHYLFPAQTTRVLGSLVNNPFAEFVDENRSLSAAFAYIICTSVITNVSVITFIIHAITYILIFTMRWRAHRARNGKSTSILMLISIALTAYATDMSPERLVIEALSIVVLGLMWWLASIEGNSLTPRERMS